MLSEAYDTWVALLDDKYKKDTLPNIFKVPDFCILFFEREQNTLCVGSGRQVVGWQALSHACTAPCMP